MDLKNVNPAELQSSATLGELLEAVQSLTEWDDRAAEVLDSVYRRRLGRVFAETTGEEELLRLGHHLRSVAHESRAADLNRLRRPWAEIWRGYARLLETRVALLRDRAPDRVRQMAHVEEILQLLAREGKPVGQTHVRKALHLKSANAARILATMEEHGLIVRTRLGRRKLISLPEQAHSQTDGWMKLFEVGNAAP